MATRGRNICNTLKAIRKQIADANGISYSPDECHFKGECKGTCPKCEQDVRDLEHELHLRQMAGKAIKVAGVALGITALTASATSCATQKGYYKSTPPKSEKVIPILFQEYTTNDTALLQAKDSLSKKGVLFVQGHLISDEDNEPLIGASVIAKHSGKYAITDVNGNFTLEVEQGDTITVQYIGFILDVIRERKSCILLSICMSLTRKDVCSSKNGRKIRIYSQANGIRPSVGILIMERLSEKRCRGKRLKNLAFVQTRSYCINMSLKAMWNGNWCIHSDA